VDNGAWLVAAIFWQPPFIAFFPSIIFFNSHSILVAFCCKIATAVHIRKMFADETREMLVVVYQIRVADKFDRLSSRISEQVECILSPT